MPSIATAYAARIGDLDGKTFLVTGANTGIGRETALALTGRGARVFVASRSEQKSRPVIDEIVGGAVAGRLSFLASISAISRRCACARVSFCGRKSRCMG